MTVHIQHKKGPTLILPWLCTVQVITYTWLWWIPGHAYVHSHVRILCTGTMIQTHVRTALLTYARSSRLPSQSASSQVLFSRRIVKGSKRNLARVVVFQGLHTFLDSQFTAVRNFAVVAFVDKFCAKACRGFLGPRKCGRKLGGGRPSEWGARWYSTVLWSV